MVEVVEKKSAAVELCASHLSQEFTWIKELISYRIDEHLGDEGGKTYPPAPIFDENVSFYSGFLISFNLGPVERIALILGMAPTFAPSILDGFFVKDPQKGRFFSAFGGVPGVAYTGFLPTLETFYFLASGADLAHRLSCRHYFESGHVFAINNILTIEHSERRDPAPSGIISVSREILDLFALGESAKPSFGQNFPAKEINTKYTWEDLVLNQGTLDELEEIKIWVKHGQELLEDWGLGRKLKPGYLSLFHGPPGTGKTLTASLIAQMVGKAIFRVDLSLIVSKYIGETEKNLSSVFDQAESKNWVLFFDEADALFGKRTAVSDAHDRYANQEVSFLLQRVEDFSGLVILASNLKSNMDEAFVRRFQSIIHFPLPTADERLILWQKSFSEVSQLEEAINLMEIAEQYELSGGAIMNIVRFSSLRALSRGSKIILLSELKEGIRREFRKDGKLV